MLKHVIMGSAGILLAAGMIASSMTPPNPDANAGNAEVVPVPAPMADTPAPVVQAPPPATAAPIFTDDSGDMDFGAPMIETAPVESGTGNAAALTAQPESAEANGGKQFRAGQHRHLPTPM